MRFRFVRSAVRAQKGIPKVGRSATAPLEGWRRLLISWKLLGDWLVVYFFSNIGVRAVLV